MSTGWLRDRVTIGTPQAAGWSHYWPTGGRMLVAQINSMWPHAAGGRQPPEATVYD